MPAKVTAPVVAVEGVNPVVPALNEDTPAGNDVQAGTPLESVKYCPFEPAAKNVVDPDPV